MAEAQVSTGCPKPFYPVLPGSSCVAQAGRVSWSMMYHLNWPAAAMAAQSQAHRYPPYGEDHGEGDQYRITKVANASRTINIL